MKKLILSALVISAIVFVACKKNKSTPETPVDPTPTETYSSLQDFYSKNAPTKQIYTINASTGGTIISSQATTITIPANAFVNMSNVPITGNVTLEFIDIYKKSDMLLSDIPSINQNGMPLKSAGEFFINVLENGTEVNMAFGKKIMINQPLNGVPLDSLMQPFDLVKDSAQRPVWAANTGSNNPYVYPSMGFNPTDYVFGLYANFASSPGQGGWCNSDDPSFFANYSQTKLTMHPNFSTNGYYLDVFLVFKSINSMIHVYKDYSTSDYPYYFAPIGLQCTMVAVGVKDGKVFSSFTPITISANQTVNYTLNETTSDAFKTALKALN